MRCKKTPQGKRATYKLYDYNGSLVTEYIPGKDGVTEIDILNLHKMDDHEVYINCKELKLPEWYQPIYNKWRETFIANFKERYGRDPLNDEIPNRHRTLISIDAQIDADGDEFGDSSHLERELSVSDEDDTTSPVIRLREIIDNMPEQWQKVYRFVMIEGLSKAETGRIIGISDVRVGQLVKKINNAIANDKELKNFFR